MKILYGVTGEGVGHAIRSRVLLEELVKEHEVHIVVSGRATEYLEKRFANVHRIWGLTIATEAARSGGCGRCCGTSGSAVRGWPKNIRLLRAGGKFRRTWW